MHHDYLYIYKVDNRSLLKKIYKDIINKYIYSICIYV